MTSSSPLIIGLAGKARHGKDTVADYLVQHHGFVRLAYADAIRDMLECGLGIEPRYLTTDKEAFIPWLGVTGRHLMQTLGTEWGRSHVRPDLWRLLLARKIDALADDADRIVISDVRFRNEADWVRDALRGSLWHIYRPGLAGGPSGDHASEAGITIYPGERYLINKEGDFAYLYDAIEDILKATLTRDAAAA